METSLDVRLKNTTSGSLLIARDLVAEVAERAFGELHDVALMDQGHRLALVLDRVADRAVHDALDALPADRLDADADFDLAAARGHADAFQLAVPRIDARLGAETDLVEALGEFLFEEIQRVARVSA